MSDTIAAIATPSVPSAIGILRLSGPAAISAASAVFRPVGGRPLTEYGDRHLVLGALLGPDGAVIDPFGGQADLTAGVIRCVGDPDRRFGEDALRMLRAVRFAAQLGFAIHPDTEAAIRRCAPRAALVSGERIRAEVEKTLLSPRPERAADLLRWGLLAHLWPVTDCPALDRLAALPPEPIPRWRGFCQSSGFPIQCLPVERALRRAVLHPEAEVLHSLALSGGELAALGLAGEEIGRAQRKLARHVLAHPEDNRRERLLTLLDKLD